MKIRTNYVTNSSSSSFVVAFKFKEIDEETLKKYPFLAQYEIMAQKILYSYSDNTETSSGTKIDSIDQLEEWLLHNYYCHKYTTFQDLYNTDQDIHEQYDLCRKYLASGYHILVKNIGYEDDILMGIFHQMQSDNFIILMEDGAIMV